MAPPSRERALASRPATPTRGQSPEWRKAQSCGLQQARPCLGTSWALAPPKGRPMQALGLLRPHTQLCQETHAPQTLKDMTAALGSLSPAARLQDPALSASSLALIPGPGFTHQCGNNSSRVFQTQTLPTSKPALALWPPGVLQSVTCW